MNVNFTTAISEKLPDYLYIHLSLQQALRDIRTNTLIQKYNDVIDRYTNLCLRKPYTMIDNVIFTLDTNKLKYNYMIEKYNLNIYLVSFDIKEMNNFITNISISEEVKSESLALIERYSKENNIPLTIFKD